MSTPLRYQILVSNSPDELAVQVSNFLTQGWRLQGELVVVAVPAGEGAVTMVYVREMVR